MSPTVNQDKSLLKALRGIAVSSPPIWLMRQAGRYLPEYKILRAKVGGFLDLCLTPSYAAEITLQPINRFQLDAAIIFSDILVIPYAFGQKLEFHEGIGPCLPPLDKKKGLKELSVTNFSQKLYPVYEAIGLTKAKLPKPSTLIGFAGSPWTVATYMIEGGKSQNFDNARSWLNDISSLAKDLFYYIEESTITHISCQIEAGVEAYQLFDSWAGALYEYPDLFRRFVIEPNRRIISSLKNRYPNIPAIAFPRGSGKYYYDFVRKVKPEGLGFDTKFDPNDALSNLAPFAVLQGNLDPLLLVSGGRELRESVKNLLQIFKNKPYIFNLGHGVLPSTPPETVSWLVSAVRSGCVL